MADVVSNSDRLNRICSLLGTKDGLAIAELAQGLSVSEMTVRRDVAELQRAGLVQRSRGLVIATQRLTFELNFTQRRRTRQAQKRAIAAMAARMVQPGQRIFVDAGSTTLEFIYLIREIPDLVIVTTSLAVASTLQYADAIETVLLGGRLLRGRPDLGGGFTEDMLDLFSADMAFQGADGIDLEGNIYNAFVNSARVGRKMRQKADRTYILADSTKLNKSALVKFGNLKDGTALITDDEIDPEHLRVLREGLGVTVMIPPRSLGALDE